jgi:integrase
MQYIEPPHRYGERSFSDDEIDKLFTACTKMEEKMMLLIELSYGLRREDCANLMLDDIEVRDGKPVILKYIEKKKHLKIIDPATKKKVSTETRFIRTHDIGPRMSQELALYLNYIKQTRKGGRLFQSRESGMSGRTLYNWLQKLCVKAGILPRPFHCLRSTCIKRHLRAGWTIQQVADLVHDSVRVVEMHYTTPSKDEMREMMTKKEVI